MTRRLRRAAAAATAVVLLAAGAAGAAVLLRDDVPVPAPLAGGGPPDEPPRLDDLWSGRAALVLDKKWTSTSLGLPGGGGYAGAHVEVVGDTWYLFHRTFSQELCGGGHGADVKKLGTQVRASTDGGATWSEPSTVVAPTAGTPWACMGTDGDAYYDAGRQTWGYLFQCQSEAPGWHGCYVERRAASPLGKWRPPAPGVNPVITPGLLWGPICDDPGDECYHAPGQRPIGDEGTFDVFDAGDGGWWVGFHGQDGSRAWRGLARTETFRRDGWQVDGAGGTPKDASLDAADAAGWRENWLAGGPVGAGAGRVLEQDGRYYQLAEVPDVSLGCTPGQNWDLGLFRTSRLAATKWEQIPAGNPVVYSSRDPDASGTPIMCNVEYPGLFADPESGTSYLMHGRLSHDPRMDGIYVYRLEWDRNLLVNGGFGRADAHGWEPRPAAPARMSVERRPDGSPDGTQYLALDCGGATCDGGPSVFQDVTVEPDLAGRRLAFGGTFRAESGAQQLEMAVLQLDAAGDVIADAVVPVAATETYARARGELEVDERARRLRFELYPRTPAPLRADNLYLIPQDGCEEPRYPAC